MLPRVAGFDIYPYVRIAAVALAALIALIVLRRSARRGVAAGSPGPSGPAPARRHASAATTWSIERVSAATSAGSTDGNIATRSWLRPSLR